MSKQHVSKRNVLAVVLSLVFLLAMVMGCGPGLYLVNPDTDAPNSACSVLGMPVVYVWAVFWFLVQAAVIVVAYCWLWNGR